MIRKYNEIKEIKSPTVGITIKFAEDVIHKESIENYQKRREDEEKENERKN